MAVTVVAYVRVSTHEQAGSGLSVEAQTLAVQSYCTFRQLPSPRVLSDLGVSASVPFACRPGGSKALAALGPGSHLVVAKLDRAWRSVRDCVETTDLLRERGVTLHLLDLQVSTDTAAGRMFLSVAAAFAQFERDRLSERTREAMSAAKARGVTFGRSPFGELPGEAETLSLIRRLSASGLSSYQIAGKLDPCTSRSGRPWSPRTIRRLLARHSPT